jgi:hypothetical protein
MPKTFQFSKHLTINQEYKNLFLLLKILKQVLATNSVLLNRYIQGLLSLKRTIISYLHPWNTKKATTYDVGNPGPDLGQAQNV